MEPNNSQARELKHFISKKMRQGEMAILLALC